MLPKQKLGYCLALEFQQHTSVRLQRPETRETRRPMQQGGGRMLWITMLKAPLIAIPTLKGFLESGKQLMTPVFWIKRYVLAYNFTTHYETICYNSYISTLHLKFFSMGLQDLKARKTDAQHKTTSTPNSKTSHSQPDLKADIVCKCRSRCTAKKTVHAKRQGSYAPVGAIQ